MLHPQMRVGACLMVTYERHQLPAHVRASVSGVHMFTRYVPNSIHTLQPAWLAACTHCLSVLQAVNTGGQRHSRSKRPRETASPAQTPHNQCHSTQQSACGVLPYLPSDLYAASMEPSGLSAHHANFAKPTSCRAEAPCKMQHFPTPQSCQHFGAGLQQFAAIAAFRPGSSSAPTPNNRVASDVTACAACCECCCSCAAATEPLAAALAGISGLGRLQQQQPADLVELPFPGMHTLSISPDYAQPVVYEAVQQLLDHSEAFLDITTCCPLPKVPQTSWFAPCSITKG